jgi:hypothetical protein
MPPTDEQIGFIRLHGHGMTGRALCAKFNAEFGTTRHESTINRYLREFTDRDDGRRYTGEQIGYLESIYRDHGIKEITALFNERFKADRSVYAIKTVCGERKMRGKNRFLTDGQKNSSPPCTEGSAERR